MPEQKGADLLKAGQQEGLQAVTASIRPHLTDVPEEGSPQLPVTVTQEGDHGGKEEVIALPACENMMRLTNMVVE